MQSAILEAPGRSALHPFPTPEPGPGEVRIRLEGSGVCASSLPLWQGRDWFEYPQSGGMPGHEGWGDIEALGDGVTDFRVGQRVTALSQHAFAEHDVAPVDEIGRASRGAAPPRRGAGGGWPGTAGGRGGSPRRGPPRVTALSQHAFAEYDVAPVD